MDFIGCPKDGCPGVLLPYFTFEKQDDGNARGWTTWKCTDCGTKHISS